MFKVRYEYAAKGGLLDSVACTKLVVGVVLVVSSMLLLVLTLMAGAAGFGKWLGEREKRMP